MNMTMNYDYELDPLKINLTKLERKWVSGKVQGETWKLNTGGD